MANATRFPRGLSTFPSRSTLNTFPIATSPSQIALFDDFTPYRAGDWTVTQTNGSATPVSYSSGVLKLATAGSTAADTISLCRNGGGAVTTGMNYAFVPGCQLWLNFRVCYPRSVLNASDTTVRFGLNNALASVGTNAILFNKANTGTAVSMTLSQGGTQTIFNNIGDLALPSGLFNDAQSSNALLSATIAGNAFTGVTVASPGSGYLVPPMVLSTATSGVAGNFPVWAGLGSASFAANTGQPVLSTALPYASVFAPEIINAGSGYTNAGPLTTLLEVDAVQDYSIYFDGKNTLFIGINGRTVLTVGASGIIPVANGVTTNVATAASASFFASSSLSSGISPVAQLAGSALGMLPLGQMAPWITVTNSTANPRSFYLLEVAAAVEYL